MFKAFFAPLFIAVIFPWFLMGEVKICLSMLVKNEEAVIERCLNSVKDIVDFISICDVGSNDNTVPLIEEFLQKTGKPGKITRVEFENFSYNRTVAVQTAQKALNEFGCSLSETYLLTLDADMTVNAMSAFKKNELEADFYLLPEQSRPLSYYTYSTRLLRASRPWENQGSTCGSWVYQGPQQGAKLLTLSVEDHGDGDLTADQRNVQWVEKNLKSDPDNTCLTLRLAHLHRVQKQYDEAIHWYKTRIAQGGDKEEVWFSHYLIGKCLEGLGEWNLACQRYFETYEFNPGRAEPLLEVATHYRVGGQNHLAYLFAKHGSQIQRSPDQTLFNGSPLENFQFDQELAISSYYTHFKKDGYEHASALIIKKNVPWAIKDQTYKNLLFYAPHLKLERFMPIQIELPLIRSGHNETYHPMNPSLIKTSQGYELICRTVNYTQKGAVPSNFKTIDPNGIYRTRNFLVRYDPEFNLLSQQEIIEYLPRRQYPTNVEGLEDCRLFEWNQQLWFTCTTRDANPSTTPQIALCQLGENKGNATISVQKLIPLKGPDPERCEKNWLPFIKDGQLHLIYSYDPLVLYKFQAGRCELLLSHEQTYDFSHFRGSAAPIVFDDGYLLLVHESVQFPDWTRRYLHRFVYLDDHFRILRISNPFFFLHLGIEFCCSMTLDHEEKELILAIGIEDNQAGLCFVNLDTVRSMLIPLSQE